MSPVHARLMSKGAVVPTGCRGEDELMTAGVSAFDIPSRQSVPVKKMPQVYARIIFNKCM